jgi:hypothetical protein
MSYRTLRRVATGLLAVAAFAVCAVSATSASTGPAKPDVSAQFTTAGSVAPQFLQNATTIEHWTFQYTDPQNHVTYPITMVGKDPRVGGTSTIHTVIIALKMNFVAGHQDTSALTDLGFSGFTAPPLNHTFNADRRVSSLLNSPIFQNATYPAATGGLTGQLSDTFMRSQFPNAGGSNYHVNLVNDGVKHVTLDVPAANGLAYQRPVGAWRTANGMPTDTITGVADVNWFSTQLQSLMGSLQISATTVPIFLTDNVLLYQGHDNYLNCCILGYHGAGMPIGHGAGSANGNGKQPVQTFIYGAWTTPGTYSGFLADYLNPSRTAPAPTRGLADIHALSHEVSEWLDDPYVNNAVQPWLTPTAPQYGCTGVLETGDPVVGVWFPLSGNNEGATDGYNYYGQYHPEDEVYAQWFGRGGVEPVLGNAFEFNGKENLTFMGPLTTGIGGPYAGFGSYAQGCS